MSTLGWIILALLGLLLVIARRRRRAGTGPAQAARRIVVDGTNVLFWRENTARLDTLQMVVRRLTHEGFTPLVFLDASSRHHLSDRSLDEARFAQALSLPATQVRVVPKGTEADGHLLQYAQDHKLPVLSNDRFRDRPGAARNLRLVKGYFKGDRLMLKGL